MKFEKLIENVVAGPDGQWVAEFPAMPAGGPYTASFTSAAAHIQLDDLLIGEVWICSGQSNMAFTLNAAVKPDTENLRAQNSDRLRLLNRVPIAETGNFAWDSVTMQKINGLRYFDGSWTKCDSTNAGQFSALAYFFGQALQNRLSVPVGLIHVSVGGSTTESWIDRFTLEHDPVLVNVLRDWIKSDFFQPWVRERASLNIKNSSAKIQRHPYEPAYNFEAGIQPLTKFPVKGVIWYQGESNAHNPELHEFSFKALVKSWRKQWGYELPFYYVQLSSLNRPSWPYFRYSQAELLKKIPATGMVVSSDLGDSLDVHPKHKMELGERLARAALHFSYGMKKILPYGPVPVKAIRDKSKILLSFEYAGKGLQTRNNEPLTGFSYINEKGIMKNVPASLKGKKVLVEIPETETAVEIRYAWAPFTRANLENSESLPASTFKMKIE